MVKNKVNAVTEDKRFFSLISLDKSSSRINPTTDDLAIEIIEDHHDFYAVVITIDKLRMGLVNIEVLELGYALIKAASVHEKSRYSINIGSFYEGNHITVYNNIFSDILGKEKVGLNILEKKLYRYVIDKETASNLGNYLIEVYSNLKNKC